MITGVSRFGEKPIFKDETGINIQFMMVKDTGLRMTPGVLTVVYVLRGELYAKVSCEEFFAKAGDYLVFNQGDPYFLTADGDSAAALLQFDLAAFDGISPYLDDIIFACESFDLARYRNEERFIRDILNQIIDVYATRNDRLEEACRAFLEVLMKGYTLYNYYNRTEGASAEKVEKYLRIMHYMTANLRAKNLLERVAEKEHYTKTYISHLFKEVSAGSFSETLSCLRVFAAERLLLRTDRTIAEISYDCGFSDVKYFNKNYKKWFHQSPLEYRKEMKPRVGKDPRVEPVQWETVKRYMADIEESREEDAAPRLSVTPLLLKSLGTSADLFKRLEDYQKNKESLSAAAATVAKQAKKDAAAPHLMPLLITEEGAATEDYALKIDTLLQARLIPCLVFFYTSKKSTEALFDAVLSAAGKENSEKISAWLKYSCLGDREKVDQMIRLVNEKWGLAVLPLFIP